MAELTEFKRNLRKVLSNAEELAALEIDFWTLAPENVPFAWWGAVADIPPGWAVIEEAEGRYIIGSTTSAGDVVEASATALADHDTHTATVGNHVDDLVTSTAAGGTDTVTDDGTEQKTVNIAIHDHFLSLNLAHTATVSAHSAHVVSQDYVPPSISFIWIMKVAA